MPMLYFAGICLCFVMYWTSKYLFIYHNKIPPKYGIELAQKVRNRLEWSTLLHVIVSSYLFSQD